ncbi:ECF transporter S component [Marinilactibacillus kalidii]|uniref:ECF transporter S component n=1 Tax=Marinilactibacillus kalidii TaxID=2820274 RepID=UPI0031345389
MTNKNKTFSVYRVTVLALLIAAVQTSRLLFSFLPNVQPVTVLLILILLTFGYVDALIVGTGAIVVSNLYLGMGPWTLSQIFAYGVVVSVSFALSVVLGRFRKILFFWVIYAIIAGFLYGLVISIFHALLYGLTFQAFLAYWIAGLWFDGYHAIGNGGFMLILYPVLLPLFEKMSLKIKTSQS